LLQARSVAVGVGVVVVVAVAVVVVVVVVVAVVVAVVFSNYSTWYYILCNHSIILYSMRISEQLINLTKQPININETLKKRRTPLNKKT